MLAPSDPGVDPHVRLCALHVHCLSLSTSAFLVVRPVSSPCILSTLLHPCDASVHLCKQGCPREPTQCL